MTGSDVFASSAGNVHVNGYPIYIYIYIKWSILSPWYNYEFNLMSICWVFLLSSFARFNTDFLTSLYVCTTPQVSWLSYAFYSLLSRFSIERWAKAVGAKEIAGLCLVVAVVFVVVIVVVIVFFRVYSTHADVLRLLAARSARPVWVESMRWFSALPSQGMYKTVLCTPSTTDRTRFGAGEWQK